MKKALVIYNPVSGAKKIWNVPKIIRNALHKHNYTYEWFETIPAEKQPLEQFLNKNFDRIIVIGGDGTIKEVAEFLVQNKIKTALGIISQGSANIVAHSLNIPMITVQGAINFALEKEAQALDVMKINQKYIGLIAAGQGYDAIFIKGATRGLKRKYGFFAYLISFLKTFFIYPKRSYNIVIDGERHYAYAKMVAVFNLLSITQTNIGKHISPQDGKLNIAIFNPMSVYDFIYKFAVYIFRLHRQLRPKMRTFEGKKISINRKNGKYIQIDGEVYKGKNLQVEVLPAALNVVYKKKF